jgi:3'-phosphoadenosine 5'-phosphosulfate sulfotransferase (PAPS reductase)/FAD synthetase
VFSASKFTNDNLKELQSLPLDLKIQKTATRVMEWQREFDGKVYISFSGGKDSTVLLDIARKIDPRIEAVFVNTGLEYPEISQFAMSKDNVKKLKPKIRFDQVIDKYGYPVVSKEQAAFIQEYRDTKSDKLADIRWNGNKYGRGKISEKWKFLVDAPFKISDKCCDVMKKEPCKQYEKETGNYPIIGTMASESAQRKSNWLMYGCNAFDKKRPTSQPMSFWTEQDVLMYLKYSNIPYASIYGDIIEIDDGVLATTGESRTGCMFCMFGVHAEGCPNKFQRMKITHPNQYDYCIRNEKGLGLGSILDYMEVAY